MRTVKENSLKSSRVSGRTSEPEVDEEIRGNTNKLLAKEEQQDVISKNKYGHSEGEEGEDTDKEEASKKIDEGRSKEGEHSQQDERNEERSQYQEEHQGREKQGEET